MKKQLGFVALFVMFFAFGTSAYGQMLTTQTSQDAYQAAAEAKFKTLYGLIDATSTAVRRPAAEAALSRSEEKMDYRSVPSGPGDHPIFVLRANHQFVNEGETLELSVIPMITMSKTLNGSIQILKPGYSGEYDGSIPPAYAPFSTPSQELENIRTLQPIKILSRVFNAEDNPGRYTFNIVTWNSVGGLEQQVIAEVYYGYAGQYGRYNYISKVAINPQGIVLTGRFPAGLPIYYYMGNKFGGTVTGPDAASAPRSNGTKLVLGSWASWNITVPMDIMIWAPGSRYAILTPIAYVEDVPLQ